MKIRFEITPVAKQGAMFFARNGRVMSYAKPKAHAYEKDIRTLAIAYNAKEKFYTEKPIVVKNLVFAFPFPTSTRKKDREKGWIPKATKPDIDNLMKALWDAIEGVFFLNDSQIYKIENLEKRYSDHGYIELEMREATDSEVSLMQELDDLRRELIL